MVTHPHRCQGCSPSAPRGTTASMLLTFLLACDPAPSPPPPVVMPDPEPAVDPGDAAASYTLRFPDLQAHRVQIEANARCPDGGSLQWWMPTWTPGSYLIREYARNIEAISPRGGGELTKTAKNRWTQTCEPGAPVGIDYTLYARAMSVRSSYVDAEMGVLNGAATFLFPDGDLGRPLVLTFELPEAFAKVVTALPVHPDGPSHRFLAPDVDTLIDSPIVLGNPDVRTFTVQGIDHHVVTLGEPGPFNYVEAAQNIERITRAGINFWGQIPYPEYWYLTVLAERGGGLEHKRSTLMMTSRWKQRREEDQRRWWGLVSHEFFHTWNVKRLRPKGLGPFDYENEVYTPSLWFAEGVTSYYDDLLLARADLIDEKAYLAALSRSIENVMTRPGRAFQPLASSSFDAWIKFYRGDENSENATISYYTKGAVVGWLLDAEIRRLSRGGASLDDLMRQAYARHNEDGFEPHHLREIATELAGAPLDDFFDRYVDGAEELDFGGALRWFGLRFTPEAEGDVPPGWLGINHRGDGQVVVVTSVRRGGPAWDAGIIVDDELLAIDDERLTPKNLSERLEQLGAGHTGTLLLGRRGHLRRVELTLGAPSTRKWKLEPDPGGSPMAAQRRRRWLAGE